jgi:hypothetical protein
VSDRAPNWQRSLPRTERWGGCRVCKHFRPDMTCAAYPRRIPIVIASGEVDHLIVRPGQVGDTVFEVVEQPTGSQERLLESAAARDERWAIQAFANAPGALPGHTRRN